MTEIKPPAYIDRYYDDLGKYCEPGKALIIFGASQVGKTTLIKHYLNSFPQLQYKLDTGDNVTLQVQLAKGEIKFIRDYLEGYELIVIDEAQKIPNIGEVIKIIVDQFPAMRVIVTGSSSFELAGQIGEPLTGRKITLILYPIAQLELRRYFNPYQLHENLEQYLIYGSYPEIIEESTLAKKKIYLHELTNSYLLKDILTLDKIKNSKALLDLLRLLAFQIGNEVSHTELGQKLSIDAKTIARYLDLLEKSFVIYNLRGFSRNLRNEITKKSKYYFYDVGIRNAIIANFNPLELRDDVGRLWENFLIIERLKKQTYHQIYANNYFWRTWEQKEIDFIEEREGNLFGFEFKWGNQSVQPPKEWLKAYPGAKFQTINQENYLEFIT